MASRPAEAFGGGTPETSDPVVGQLLSLIDHVRTAMDAASKENDLIAVQALSVMLIDLARLVDRSANLQ